MRGLCTLIALAALTAPALLWLGPPAGGQAAAPDLAERFSPGLRRTARIERRFTRTLQAAGDTAAQTQRLDTTALVHEWYPQPDAAGRPARVVRTYRELRRVLTTEDRADGAAPVVTAADATPPWANMVLTLETANGELRVSGGAGLNDFARAAVAADFETDLQPQRAREVGRSWRIRGSGLEPLFDLGEAVEHEDGVVTVTLKSLDAARAVFEFSGALKFRHRRPDPADAARDAANLLYESTLRGSAEFDVVQGRWLGRTLTVAATISGTRDGREARGTAELSDRRVFTWGAIVDAPPPAESAFAEPPARPEVAGDGPVAPGRIVLGLANPARTALVEFDPVSGRVTRALARFPAGVAVGPPALSLDGSRLVFASTLHNDRTIEPWNIFALDLAAGRLDQLTPAWAPAQGLVRAESPSDGHSVEVQLPWTGPLNATVWVQGLSRPQEITRPERDFDGKLKLEHLPAGKHTIHVLAGRDAAWRKAWYGTPPQRSRLETTHMTGEVTVTAAGPNTARLATVTEPVPEYQCPAWAGKEAAWLEVWPGRPAPPERPAAPPGARLVAGGKAGAVETGLVLATTEGGGRHWLAIRRAGGGHVFEIRGADGEVVTALNLAASGVLADPRLGGSFSADGTLWYTAGVLAGSDGREGLGPALLAADARTGAVRVAGLWPELSGRRVLAVSAAPHGTVYLVLATGTDTADVYRYDPAADTLRRLTALGDVQGVSAAGR